jgi:hypothetical protein
MVLGAKGSRILREINPKVTARKVTARKVTTQVRVESHPNIRGTGMVTVVGAAMTTAKATVAGTVTVMAAGRMAPDLVTVTETGMGPIAMMAKDPAKDPAKNPAKNPASCREAPALPVANPSAAAVAAGTAGPYLSHLCSLRQSSIRPHLSNSTRWRPRT